MVDPFKTQHLFSRYLLVFFFFTLAVFGLDHIITLPSVKQIFADATAYRPEPLTELYFENSAGLPGVIIPQKTYPVAFTIHNLEGRDMAYRVNLSIQSGSKTISVLQEVLKISNGNSVTIEKTIGPLPAVETKVVVELPDKNQIISFWMEAK